MVRGHHIAKCGHCLKEFVCGDCIPSICYDCEQAGHKDSMSIFGCPECRKKFSPEYLAKRDKIAPPGAAGEGAGDSPRK